MTAALLAGKDAPALGDTSRVLVDLQPGERMTFAGAGITLALVQKSGRSARLCIIAPRSMKIDRERVPGADTSMAR